MRKGVTFYAVFLLTLAALYYVLLSYQLWTDTSPWNFHTELHAPSMAVPDAEGNVYVIDCSMTRIMKADAAGQMLWMRYGSRHAKKEFSCCRFLTVDDAGHIYLVNQVYQTGDNRTVRKENILQYSANGKPQKEIVAYDYTKDEDPPELYGRIGDVRFIAGKLYYTYPSVDAIDLYEVTADGPVWKKSFPVRAARTSVLHCQIDYDGESIHYLTKYGQIVHHHGTWSEVHYSSWGSNDQWRSASVVGDIAVDQQGRIFYADPVNGCINELAQDAEGVSASVLSPLSSDVSADALPLVYDNITVSADGHILAASGQQGIVLCQVGQPPRMIDSFRNAPQHQFYCVLSGLAGIWLLGLALWGFWRLLRRLRQTNYAARLFLGAVCLCFSVVVCGSYFFWQFRCSQLTEQLEASIAVLLQQAEQQIDRKALAGYRSYQDYGSSDMLQLQQELAMIREAAGEEKSAYFFVLNKTDGHLRYQVLDYLDRTPPIWPREAYEGSAFQKAAATRQPYFQSRHVLHNGIWLSGIQALYDADGHLTGFLEIGRNAEPLYAKQMRNAIVLALCGGFWLALFLWGFYQTIQGHTPVTEQPQAAKKKQRQ